VNRIVQIRTYQVKERQVTDFCRLNSEITECLRGSVNLLINEFPLNFILSDNGPPESFVRDFSNWLQDLLGHIYMPAAFDNLPVYKLGNFCCRIVLGAEQLECLGSSRVILSYLLKSFSYINRLLPVSEVER
jgi:hypothetical protein